MRSDGVPTEAQPIVALDSIPIRRNHEDSPGHGTNWYGHLAVALSLNGVHDFETKYEETIDRLFHELGLDRTRRIYSAHDLNKQLFGRPAQYDAFLYRFGRSLLSTQNLRVTAFIGSFDPEGLQRIEGVVNKARLRRDLHAALPLTSGAIQSSIRDPYAGSSRPRPR